MLIFEAGFLGGNRHPHPLHLNMARGYHSNLILRITTLPGVLSSEHLSTLPPSLQRAALLLFDVTLSRPLPVVLFLYCNYLGFMVFLSP